MKIQLSADSQLLRCGWVIILLLAAAGCNRPDSIQKPRDLLLITLDTARADRFSYIGRSSPGTPRIDALAAQGAGFANAISPVPLTLPAHASLMTGRQPPSHTVRDNGAYHLPQAEMTLAELLSEAGFTTAAFVGAQVLDARYGLDQGFATYDDDIPDPGSSAFLYYAERRGEEVAAAAMRWLDGQDEGPVFAWVHLFDPHTPYRPPEPERSRYSSAYDGEIAYADRVVGELLDRWEERRGLDRTVVVVTSDHGEALGEHDERTHGVLVHGATLRVPLVIRVPDLQADRVITEPVSLIDVMPTVLGLLGVGCPEIVQGRDLTPLLRGEPVAWSPICGYAESLYGRLHHGCAPLWALQQGGWKLIRGLEDELYDLDSDPGERHDLAAVESQRRASLGAELDDVMADLQGGEAERLPVDEETHRALRALGYIGFSPSTEEERAPLRDPREALRSMRRMADADRSALAGDIDGAVVVYRELIDIEPNSIDGRVRLAQILLEHDRFAEALELLVDAVALAPHEPFLHQRQGFALEKLGRFEEGLAVYDGGLAQHSDNTGLRDGRWRCLNQLGRQAVMLAEAERAIAADPSDGMARYARAIACCGQPLSSYLAALQRELDELPGDPVLEAALARARVQPQNSGGDP